MTQFGIERRSNVHRMMIDSLSRAACKCSLRCLESSKEGILCIALWELSHITQIVLHCPCPLSSSLTFHWRLQALFCCGSSWRACQWGWFSIFFTSSRTREFSACCHSFMWQSRCSEVNVDLVDRCGRTGWLSNHNGSPRSVMICIYVSLSLFLQSREKRVSISWALEWDVCSVSFIQSCLKDIFGGIRGDSCTCSFLISPVSIRTTFGIQQVGSVSWRMIALDRVWQNFNPFLKARLMLTQHTVFWCFFHALCMYRARRGAFKSIVSGSLCSLSIGSTSRKNTVCWLLKCWPPGVNPEFMMECKLIAHPTWEMCLKKLSGTKTLSWNEGSTRLRPEWPWRARRKKNFRPKHQCNTKIFSCFLLLLLLPCCSSTFHQTNIENSQIRSEENLLISRIHSLHQLLEVDDHDEEEYSVVLTLGTRLSVSLTLSSQRARILVVQCQSKFFPQKEKFSWMSWQRYVFVVLLWPLFGWQNHLHSILTHGLRTASQRSPARCRRTFCRSSLWPICHEKFWPTS